MVRREIIRLNKLLEIQSERCQPIAKELKRDSMSSPGNTGDEFYDVFDGGSTV